VRIKSASRYTGIARRLRRTRARTEPPAPRAARQERVWSLLLPARYPGERR
jgi:hypothetical protein